MKYLPIIVLYFVMMLSHKTKAQEKLKNYTFKEVDSILKKSKKNTVIFIHTTWCKYCLKMEQTTFKDDIVITLLNEKFLYIFFNAETKNTIYFNGQEFKYIPNGINSGVNELALALAKIDKKISYPTLVILNNKYEIIFQYNQFMNSSMLEEILKKLQ